MYPQDPPQAVAPVSAQPDVAEAVRRPVHVWADLGLAGGVAVLAGATDAYGLTLLHDVYVSFMSGNTTMLGISAGSADGARAGYIGALIGLFVAGAAAGAVVSDTAGRFHMPCVILAASAALCLPAFAPGWTLAFVVSMGTLNAALGRIGGESVGLTYVTGALVKFGEGLGHWLTGARRDLSWLVHAATWTSVLLGAVLATLAIRHGVSRPWPLPLFGCVLAVLALATVRMEAATISADRG